MSASTRDERRITTARDDRRTRTDELQKLWRTYRLRSDPKVRDRIILTLAPLVKFIVYRKVRELPAQVEAEDFISVGLEALIQSIDRYDPNKGATLEQYAWTRVHGAILDEMRRQDWAPRSVRRWERDIEKAVEEFTALHGRRPTATELAEALGCTLAELRRHREDIAQSDVTSLNALVLSDDDTRSSAATRSRPTTRASTPSTPPRPPTRRTASARRSPTSRSASARSPSCSTSSS